MFTITSTAGMDLNFTNLIYDNPENFYSLRKEGLSLFKNHKVSESLKFKPQAFTLKISGLLVHCGWGCMIIDTTTTQQRKRCWMMKQKS